MLIKKKIRIVKIQLIVNYKILMSQKLDQYNLTEIFSSQENSINAAPIYQILNPSVASIVFSTAYICTKLKKLGAKYWIGNFFWQFLFPKRFSLRNTKSNIMSGLSLFSLRFCSFGENIPFPYDERRLVFWRT